MKSCGVTTQIKAFEQHFLVVLFIMLQKTVLTFSSVDEIVWCGNSNKHSSAVFLQGTSC